MDDKPKIKLVSQLMAVAGIFCLAVALLLLLNYLHLRQNNPLESPAINSLVEQFKLNPDNEELVRNIRNLDLMARKAYFTSQWQIRTGAFLLLFGAIAFAVLLRIYHDLKKRIGEPLIEAGNTQLNRILSQRWILIAGGMLLGSALLASWFTNDYLRKYRSGELTGEPVAAIVTPAIEVIDLSSVDSGAETGDNAVSRSEAEIPTKVGTGTSEQNGDPDESRDQQPATSSEAKIPTKVGTGNPERSGDPDESRDQQSSHPNFRGHLGQGISSAKNVPVDWDGPTGKNIRWKVKIPKHGYNSPVIWGDRVFLAGADAQGRWVFCFNRHDGSLLWQHEAVNVPGSPSSPPRVTGDTGLSAPTVAVDGQRIFAIFGTGDLICLDLEGKRIWAKNLGVPDNHYGHSSSLITWNNILIVQYDTNKSGRLIGFNVSTGNVIWDTPRKAKISWASPMLASIDGKMQVVTVSSPTVAGFDPENGTELWAIDCLSGEVGPSAAFGNGLVYAANEYATLAAIDPGPDARIVWTNDEYLPETASPVVSEGLLFIATSYGVFACYDSENGTKYWEDEFGQGFYGSPMVADGKVYAMDRGGTMHIYKLDKEKTKLGDPVLGEKSVVTPAFANGVIYLRGDQHLYCVGGS